MYDSTKASDIPLSAQMVGGYVDGLYKWSAEDWLRFPKAVKVRIAVFQTTNDGHVLDVEKGNATPAQSVDWVIMRRKSGGDPTIYCAKALWPTVIEAFTSRNVRQPHYWIANWNDKAVIPNGAIACQYADSAIVGKHYDVSIVEDYWPGVDPERLPIPFIEKEVDMFVASVDATTLPYGVKWPGDYLVGNGVPVHIVSVADKNELLAACGQKVPAAISYRQWQLLGGK